MATVATEIGRSSDDSTRRASVLTPTRLGFGLAFVVLVAGWFLPLDRYVSPRQGLGYWLGIAGGSMMLLLLVYPLRKRFNALAAIGSARAWFQIHMALGVAGPLLILYHCLYRMGATNSNVALVCMLIVSGSGVMGRYLYARIHHGLYGRQATLAEFRADADRLRAESSGVSRLLPNLSGHIDTSEQRINRSWGFLPKPLTASIAYRIEVARLRRYVDGAVKRAATESTVIAEHAASLRANARRYCGERLSAARHVAEFEGCARLFGLWHVLHIPLFFMLLIAGVVHVIAVHVY